MIKAVVFDMDDTLYAEYDFVKSGFKAVDQYLNQNYSVSNFYNKAMELFDSGRRGKIFNEVLEELNAECNNDIVKCLLDVYRNHKPTIELFEDAKWAINYYNAKCETGLITDGYYNVQKNKVAALGLESYLKTIVYSDEYGRENWKPSMVPYNKIEERFGFESNQYVYVADNLSKDFITPKKLGWLTVHIDRDGGQYSKVSVSDEYLAHVRISSLYELKDVLKVQEIIAK